MAAPPASSQDAINQQEWDSSWNWSSRGYYSSKVDTRLFVPKRGITGSGSALNFGHPLAKLVIATMSIPLVVGLLLVAFALLSRHN